MLSELSGPNRTAGERRAHRPSIQSRSLSKDGSGLYLSYRFIRGQLLGVATDWPWTVFWIESTPQTSCPTDFCCQRYPLRAGERVGSGATKPWGNRDAHLPPHTRRGAPTQVLPVKANIV